MRAIYKCLIALCVYGMETGTVTDSPTAPAEQEQSLSERFTKVRRCVCARAFFAAVLLNFHH